MSWLSDRGTRIVSYVISYLLEIDHNVFSGTGV